MWWIIIPVLIIIIVGWLNKESKERINNLAGKTVFITGCDSGFGHELALRLDRLELKVYAGCLTTKGIKELKEKASPDLEAFICDITKEEDIRKAERMINHGAPHGLWALVNNAGVGLMGEWDWLPERYIKSTMEVNFFGHVLVTRTFLPLLKKSKGRIINLTSIIGSFGIMRCGIYTCSKFAMEAFNDTLRREMRKWGISVYVVEPGFTSTPMVSNMPAVVDRIWSEVDDEKKREYGDEYSTKLLPDIPLLEPPGPVVDALQDKRHPSLRSRVGRDAVALYWITTLLPTSFSDCLLSFILDRKSPLPASLSKK